jgi:hypothetical protein
MPNYNEMSLIELKQAAKGRGIKLYYIKKHAELVQLLSLPELPLELRLQKRTIRQLREEAKAKGLPGIWKYSRAELMELLYPSKKSSADQNEQNHGDAKEHDDPENHSTE